MKNLRIRELMNQRIMKKINKKERIDQSTMQRCFKIKNERHQRDRNLGITETERKKKHLSRK